MADQTQTTTPTYEDTAQDVAGGTCPNCGMNRDEWQGNGGLGYEYQGQTYCCEGCADGSGCTCQ
jgi:hypothetical protein